MRNERLYIRVTEEEKSLIRNKAETLNMTITALFLDTLKGVSVEDYKIKRERLVGLIKISGEVRKIGVNVNQITMKLNNISNEKRLGFEQIILGLQNEIVQVNKMMDEVLKTINDIR